ncbi:putative transmembrane protein [Bacteroides coprosuis DSM 18011]|uniref:Putative transmembrane protein n=1 Tax=Bacteroides coprosuis DSM 18011 TaxID=679937 RepID=F3ZSZ4_9BACE|nr:MULTISPECIES: hypothetical protein [Bacteroides]EGJ70956.1 putative transmembrane protein [Bacteroides coprosuis DSM 18011]HJD92029.1 hypothetical protein [Bacteroides coprosuis]
MSKKGNLSSAFNMSLGFLPILVTIVLCLFISQDIAIYIGTGIGALASLRTAVVKGAKVPRFILYISTIILFLFTVATFVYCKYCPYGYLPLTIEISAFIMMAILYMHKQRFINFFIDRQDSCSKRFYAQGAESAVVAARIFLMVASIHFALILVLMMTAHPILETHIILFNRYLPPIVFLLTIVFNQIAIFYFNRITRHIEYVPIVNKQGAVIGKTMALEAIRYKNEYINPVIRIAAFSQGKLYLCNRSQNCIIDQDKIDIPMECYLKYGETLEHGAKRLIKNAFPKVKGVDPFFNIMYHFENKHTNRLIYLFMVETDNPDLLYNLNFKNGRLWTFQEVEAQMGKNMFSECFKHEYQHLKEVICTREKYKEL